MNGTMDNDQPVGWRPDKWADLVGIGSTKMFELIAAGAVNSVLLGRARIITTSPAAFLDELQRRQASGQPEPQS